MEKTCMEWRFVPRKPITCSGVIETQNDDDDGTCIKKDPGKQFVTTHQKNKYQGTTELMECCTNIFTIKT